MVVVPVPLLREESAEERKKRGQQDMCRGMVAWGQEGGVRDIGMQRKGDALVEER